ncbi:MAG: endonuclease, partial [Bacilli bacterium]
SGAVLGKLSTLLTWNQLDPVDDFERNRNDVIYGYQGNRNPFVDHPEFADMIWETNQIVDTFDVKVYQILYIYNDKSDYISI